MRVTMPKPQRPGQCAGPAGSSLESHSSREEPDEEKIRAFEPVVGSLSSEEPKVERWERRTEHRTSNVQRPTFNVRRPSVKEGSTLLGSFEVEDRCSVFEVRARSTIL